MAMRMKDSENVTQFAKRFWTTFSEVENGDEGIAIKSFKQGLLPGNDLRKDLVRFPVNSISALMSRINQFIKQEEDEVRALENFENSKSRDRSPPRGKKTRTERRAVVHVGKKRIQLETLPEVL